MPDLTPSDNPLVSIVVSSWNGLDHTLRCLASIGAASCNAGYEVIVVDDASTDPGVIDALKAIEGIRLELLTSNLGYLRATNRGVSLAKAPYVVLLNNDVQVLPGWLDALVERVQGDPLIGAVGARLVYPDGRLQEAGAIVWSDGSGWNYGRGDMPTSAEYRFAREVDYCSAACLLVRRPDGPLFDERFAPAYYEDADVCFGVRSKGMKVVYEPRCVVFHHEGVSHGTDVASGMKAGQARNQTEFVRKWRRDLDDQVHVDSGSLAVARDRRRSPRILVVDEKLPTPDLDAGSVRMEAVLRQLAGFAIPIHFIPFDRQYLKRYGEHLESLGIEVLESASATRRFLRDLGAEVDLCIVSRPLIAASYLTKLRRWCPRAVVAYDMVDFHALRDRRLSDAGVDSSARLRRRIARIERDAMRAADLVIAITETERTLALDVVPDTPVVVIPMVHELRQTPRIDEAGRNRVLFVGGFLHSPNVAAAELIVDELATLMAARLPGVVIEIVGRDAPADLVARAPANVVFRGWVPDLGETYRSARVVLAPLRAGAGMKGKIGEAMSYGVPVITTEIGAEGFGVLDGRELFIRDDSLEMVDAVAKLFNDDETWLELATAGRKFVESELSPVAARSRLIDLISLLGLGEVRASAQEGPG